MHSTHGDPSSENAVKAHVQPSDLMAPLQLQRRHSDQETDDRVDHSSKPAGHTIKELPSYKLRRDQTDSSLLRARIRQKSTGSFEPTEAPIVLNGDSSLHLKTATVPVRRSSVASFRPLLTAATVSSLLAVKAAATDSHESQQFEAMMHHFQVRRLHLPPLQSNKSKDESNRHDSDTERHIAADDSVLHSSNQVGQQHTASRSVSRGILTGKTSVDLTQLPSAGNQQITDFATASYQSVEAHNQFIARAQSLTISRRQSRFSLARFLRTRRRTFSSKWRRMLAQVSAPMSPYSVTAHVRCLLLCIVFVWHITYIPFKLAFSVDDEPWRVYVEISFEMLLIADSLLKFNTCFVDKAGELVVTRKAIAWNYLTSWFLPDLVSSIPIGALGILRHGHMSRHDTLWSGGLRVHRLIHIALLARMRWLARARSARKGFLVWIFYSRYSHLLSIAWVLLWIVYIAHWMACGWKLLESVGATVPATLFEDYASNFYDALQLLQGQGLIAQTFGQNLFAGLAVLMGSIVLAVVFGNIAMLVSNFNANSTNYQHKIESVFAVTAKLQLPALLSERIHQYYEHLWREYESLDGELIQFSKELTHTLELEVLLFKYMAVIMHVPYWHTTSPDFLKQIILNIQVRVYLPDDYIIRRDEIGDEYYIINRGVCELLTGPDSFERASAPLSKDRIDNYGLPGSTGRHSVAYEVPDAAAFEVKDSESDTKTLNKRSKSYHVVHPMASEDSADPNTTKLSRGQSFGEMALIMNYHRTADARALTYVEMCVLKREQFQQILIRYPDDRKRVMTKMLTNTMVNNDIHNVYCPLRAIVASVYGSSSDDKSITAKQAAALIVEVTSTDKSDNTLRFGTKIKLQERLATRKAAKSLVMTHSSSDVAPKANKDSSQPVQLNAETRARMLQLASMQQEMFAAIKQMRAAINKLNGSQDIDLPMDSFIAAASPAEDDDSSVADMYSSTPDLQLRRAASAPSTDPHETFGELEPMIDGIADIAEVIGNQPSLASRRPVQVLNPPQARGLRPLLRRMGSMVGIYSGPEEQEPVPSPSQYADQLFLARRRVPNNSHASSSPSDNGISGPLDTS